MTTSPKTPRTLLRRFTAATAALAALATAAPAAAAPLPPLPIPTPAPAPAPAGERAPAAPWVVFGDSYAANPVIPASSIFAGHDPRAAERHPVPSFAPGCEQDLHNWPRVAARAAGVGDRGLADYSCNGDGRLPVKTLYDHVDAATARGHLGHGTRKVFLMYGALNTLQWADTVTGVAGQSPLPRAYTTELRGFAEKVRAAAPGAEIIIVGYPEIADGDRVCPVDTTGTPLSLIVPGVAGLEEGVRGTLATSAAAVGARFIDMKPLTAGHGMCAAPDQRYVSGVYDTVSNHNMKFHPTIEGSKAMGEIIARLA